MITIENMFQPEDTEYLIACRRKLHRIPELGFDLPETTAFVRSQMEENGIPFTEEYGPSSIVATLRPDLPFIIALRADMDALPVTEKTDLPFRSCHPGKMHACGHDAHTAILLCAARVLKRHERELPCQVRIIFQPNEEGQNSGAALLVRNGVLNGVKEILGMHCDNNIAAGDLGICRGASMAARHCYSISFHGKTSHAASPQNGHDALAMAVRAYNGIQVMVNRTINPLERYLCNIGALNAGSTDNVIPDYANMKISVRTFSTELDDKICNGICQIAEGAARELGGTAEVEHSIEAYPVLNDDSVCDRMELAAKAANGPEHCVVMPVKMCSEDFSFYVRHIPGCFLGMGTRNEALGCTEELHSSSFTIDESGLINGSRALVQYIFMTEGDDNSDERI